MRMRRTLLVALTVLGCGHPQHRPAQSGGVVTIEGAVRGAPIPIDAATLATVQRRTVKGQAPWSVSTAEFEGPSLLELLRGVEPKREVDLAVVHGAGGYAVAVPLPAIRQYRPVLAERASGKPIADAIADSGRFVLAWPNAESPGFDGDPRVRWWWVRDATRIELVAWFETYGKALRVPPGSTDDARRGSEEFATSCVQCHRLRDVGGKRGPDLSKGIAPAERASFVAAVRSHAERVPDTRGADLTRGLAEVAAFLEAVQIAGPLPSEDVAPELKPRDEQPLGPPPLPPVEAR